MKCLRSAVAVCLLTVACGKSGPPLPPLVKLPAAPANIVAERRGTAVDVEFMVPAANTDGTRPANVERVDVYAITGPVTMTDDQILKHGVRVGTVNVKAPRDPEQAAEPDDPDAIIEPPEGAGLDQGTVARVAEQLSSDALVAFDPSTDKSARKTNGNKEQELDVPRPLMGPSTVPASRTYVGVGVSTRGKKGPLSKRVTVPLIPPPPVPGPPTVTYDESAITVEWQPVANVAAPAAADDDVLPSTPLGQYAPAIAYHVYDVAEPAADAAATTATAATTGATQPAATFVRLTKTPVSEARFDDARITWGEKRCYVVRTIQTVGALTIESDASPVECATLTDTFPPAAPANLQAVASEGAISLIWDASTEKDLAGYLVLRAAVGGKLEPITTTPIQDPRFHDEVKAGGSFAYAVKAVDKAGNVSPESNRVEETAK